MIVLTLVVLIAAGYVHLHLGKVAHSRTQAFLTRGLLLLVGTGFGAVMARVYVPADGFGQWLVFAAGVGVVHVPAAVILWLKRQEMKERGSP